MSTQRPKLVALERDFAPRIVGDQIVGCGFDGKSVEVDEVRGGSGLFFGRGILVVVLVNGEYQLISSVKGREVQEAHGILSALGRFGT